MTRMAPCTLLASPDDSSWSNESSSPGHSSGQSELAISEMTFAL